MTPVPLREEVWEEFVPVWSQLHVFSVLSQSGEHTHFANSNSHDALVLEVPTK